MQVTAPLWVGLLVGVAFGIPASLWGIGNPETVIRTARGIDRLLLGCFLLVTAVVAALLALDHIAANGSQAGIDKIEELRSQEEGRAIWNQFKPIALPIQARLRARMPS